MTHTAASNPIEPNVTDERAEPRAEHDAPAVYTPPTLTYVGNLRDLLAGNAGTNPDGGGPPVLKKRG